MSGGKYMPTVGEHLYLQPKPSSSYYASITKRPYTVISVSPREVVIQAARCVYPDGPVYYDTMPIGFEEDPTGRIEKLHWAPKVGKWQENSVWPNYAYFGEWDYYPYLD